MATLARLGFVLAAVVGCGQSSNAGSMDAAGTGSDATLAACDPLAQTGCAAGEKCTWITTSPNGRIGCVPDGTVAVGQPCTLGPAGHDDCARGAICVGPSDARCKPICDLNSFTSSCGADVCMPHDGLFGAPAMATAGACKPPVDCDPFADNEFGKGSRPGTACPAGFGCYAFLQSSPPPTRWICMREVNAGRALFHRAHCGGSSSADAAACAAASGGGYVNGCRQGFLPYLREHTGSMQVICASLCKPAPCSQGDCGVNSANLTGDPAASPRHQCNNTDSSGTFNPATTSNNGDHCMYQWMFEIDDQGTLQRSPTSNTVGFCMDHSRNCYDPNGALTCSYVGSACSPSGCIPAPRCDTLPASQAAVFGCIPQ